MSTDKAKEALTNALGPFILTRKSTAKLLFEAKNYLSQYEPFLKSLPNNGFSHYEKFIDSMSADANTNPKYNQLLHTTRANKKIALEELWSLYRSAWS